MGDNELTASVLADALELAQRRPDAWPYRWVFPSAFSQPVNPHGSIVLPAVAGGPAVIVSYTVPRGFFFVLAALMHSFKGNATFHEGSGELLWGLFANAGSATPRAVETFADMTFSRGSAATAPWPVPGRLRFEQGTILTYRVENISLTVTTNDFVMAALLGWLEPLACG